MCWMLYIHWSIQSSQLPYLGIPFPRLASFYYTRIKEWLFWCEGFAGWGHLKALVIQAEKKVSGRTEDGTRQRNAETRKAEDVSLRLQGERLLSSSGWVCTFSSPWRASLSTPCPRVQLFTPSAWLSYSHDLWQITSGERFAVCVKINGGVRVGRAGNGSHHYDYYFYLIRFCYSNNK